MLAGALVAGAVAALLSGCSRPGQSDGDRVAEWIDGQNWVESAVADVSTDPWSPSIAVSIQLDPDVPDDELFDLARAADRKAHDAGWSSAYLTWELGDGRSFSNLGGGATLAVFLGIRDDPRYLVASARGSGDCGGFFCVTLDDDDPAVLHAAVTELLDLAAEAGGVQENLEFDAVSADGRYRVSALPDAPVDRAVALWQQIAASIPLESARAWAVQPVGDIPPSQMLDVTVADVAAEAAVQHLAATQSLVEVSVSVAGTDSTTATPAPSAQ